MFRSRFAHLSWSVLALPLAAGMFLAGCGGLASGATGAPPSPSPSAGPTIAPPTAFADWVKRDGYNGDSELPEIKKAGDWMVAHTSEETMVYIDEDISAVDRLVQWLDLHPATACWADYHAATRQSLGTIQGYFAQLRLAVVAGQALPFDVVNKVDDEATAAFNRAAPTTCP